MLRLLTTLTTHTWSKHPKKKCGTKITISPNVLIISLRAISWMLLLIINYHTETRTSTQMTFNSVLHLEGHECAHWQGRTLLQQWSNFRQMSSTMPPMNGTVLSENQTRVAHQSLSHCCCCCWPKYTWKCWTTSNLVQTMSSHWWTLASCHYGNGLCTGH